jgi:trigger factor
MSEESTTPADQKIPCTVKIEDAGPSTKKITVEISKETIAQKIDEQFKELKTEAVIPGFRKGHAPQRLLQKRFGTEVRDQVKTDLIRATFEQTIEENSLAVLGEPEMDKPEDIKLTDDAPLSYTVQVEVQPDINLPELGGIPINKPKSEVTDAHVDKAMENLRRQQGTLVPVEGRGVQEGDHLTVDVVLKIDGNPVRNHAAQSMVAHSGRIAGIEVPDLAKQLEGATAGQMRSLTLKVPAEHAEEVWRGKDLVVEITIKDIKRLELAEVTPQFVQDLGFESEQELRQELRSELHRHRDTDIKRLMRRQVMEYLLSKVNIDLPAKLSQKQAERVTMRRALELNRLGVSVETLKQQFDSLRQGADAEAANDLKTFFILDKIAKQQNIDVSEAELNGRIAQLADAEQMRPERLKQDMAHDGRLMAMFSALREEKVYDYLLSLAQVTEAEALPPTPAAEAESSAT